MNDPTINLIIYIILFLIILAVTFLITISKNIFKLKTKKITEFQAKKELKDIKQSWLTNRYEVQSVISKRFFTLKQRVLFIRVFSGLIFVYSIQGIPGFWIDSNNYFKNKNYLTYETCKSKGLTSGTRHSSVSFSCKSGNNFKNEFLTKNISKAYDEVVLGYLPETRLILSVDIVEKFNAKENLRKANNELDKRKKVWKEKYGIDFSDY